MKFIILLISFLFSPGAWANTWPEAPWLNKSPQSNASVSAIAFVSPFDLQFYRIMNIWKKLEKKYSNFQVDFLIVVRSEQNLNIDDESVKNLLRENNYTLPVLLDFKANYSKLWRAYVTPTVDLVLKGGQVISFDPGSFDPATLEKSLQKVLKDGGAPNIPLREYSNETEAKLCGHSHTLFLGEKFQKVWSSDPVSIQGGWTTKPLWLEKLTGSPATLEVTTNKSSVGILGEATGKLPVRINASLDGAKIPTDLRGKDLLEDKSGTYFFVRSLKMYDVLAHGIRLKDSPQKLTLVTDGKDLKLRGVETLSGCLEN